jgi:hypothetical protein
MRVGIRRIDVVVHWVSQVALNGSRLKQLDFACSQAAS